MHLPVMWVTCTMYLLIIQIEVKSLLASLGELCCGCVGGERTLNLGFNKIAQTSAKQAAAARTEFFAYVLAIKLIHPKEKVVWSMILRKKRELSAELSCLLLHVIMMWLDGKNILYGNMTITRFLNILVSWTLKYENETQKNQIYSPTKWNG